MRIRIRIGSVVPALCGALALVLVLVPTAEAKPTCHGKKATIVGGGGNNRIVVRHHGHGKQVVVAGRGNDLIITGKGSDVICGGDGIDRIMGGKGTDRAYGGSGDDLILNQKGKDSSFGEDGNDQIIGGPSKESADGGSGNDLVNGGSDRDALHGGLGDDLMLGDDGSDTIFGDDGSDEIHGGSGGENIFGGSGNDRLYGDLLDDEVDGGAGADLLVGGHGIDSMQGGGDDDWLRGGPNGDRYIGGGGTDTASFATETPSWNATSGVEVNLSSGAVTSPDGQDSVSEMENVLGSAFDDTITGTGGVNRLDGGPGNDKITGGAAADNLNGGPGNDSCDVQSGDQVIACGLGTVSETPADPRPPTAYAYLDPRGPDPGLYVVGRQGAGNDALVISAAGINLTVSSPNGTPISKLPISINACSLLPNNDASCSMPATPLGFVTVWGDAGDDKLRLDGSYPAAMIADLDGGPGSDVLDGTSGDDVLFSGQSGADVLNGGDGSDALLALGSGGDNLNGGGGNDQFVSDDVCQGHVYNGGPGFDIAGFARYAFAPRNGVRATLGGSATDPARDNCSPTRIQGDLEILEGSSGPDQLFGTSAKDPLILGRQGDDLIHGGGQADTIDGGAGNDSLYGDAGFDTLEAQDGARDKVIHCGAGGGEALRDKGDPVAGCKKLKKSHRKRKGR